mgnify:CR=1 FL=1
MNIIRFLITVSIVIVCVLAPAYWMGVIADDGPPPESPWDHVQRWVSQSPNRALHFHWNGGYATADDIPVDGAIVVEAYVPADPVDHSSAVTGHLTSDDTCDSKDEDGRCWDHTAVSGIAENRGTSGTWGGHFQCKQVNPEGKCIGAEINVESSGPELQQYWMQNNLGLDIIGRGYEGATNPEVGTLLRLRSSEDLAVADPARVRTGLKINGDIKHPIYIHTQHETAIVMQKGQKVCLDGVACKRYIRVNPKTGKTEIR